MIAWFSQQITVKKSPWTSSFDRSEETPYSYRPIDDAAPGLDPELEAYEGDKRYVVHLQTERNPTIVQAKRDSARASNGGLTCEACGANSVATFPGVQRDIWEVHHRLPLSEAKQQVITKLEDLAILCPTCHRAIHRTRPLQTVEQFGANFFPVHALPPEAATSD
jgi:predicted HNH restriction endonuclease